jgi:hypothetical protein
MSCIKHVALENSVHSSELSVYVILSANKQFTDFHKTLYERYAVGGHLKLVLIIYAISNKSDCRIALTFGMEGTIPSL